MPGSFAGDSNSIGKFLTFPEPDYPQILVSLMQSKAEYALGWRSALTFRDGEQGSAWFYDEHPLRPQQEQVRDEAQNLSRYMLLQSPDCSTSACPISCMQALPGRVWGPVWKNKEDAC